jgi:hypothetical protein
MVTIICGMKHGIFDLEWHNWLDFFFIFIFATFREEMFFSVKEDLFRAQGASLMEVDVPNFVLHGSMTWPLNFALVVLTLALDILFSNLIG